MPSLPIAIVRPLLAAAVALAALVPPTQWTAALLAYPPLPSRTCAITINLVPWNPGNAPDVSWSETSSSGSWPHRSGVPSFRVPPCPRAGRTSGTVGRLQLRSRSSDLLRFPAFPNCLATATGNDVVCRPIAELPPAEGLLIKKLDEAKAALHARLADLADANGVDD